MRPRGPLLVIPIAALLMVSVASAETAPLELQTAEPFAVLAGAGITNTGSTTIVGDVGSHPTPDQTGFGPGADSVALTGTNHHDSTVTATAKDDLLTAYNDAASRPDGTLIVGGELGGLTLTPGVYTDDDAPDSLALTGTLTLDGLDDPDSVFIFQSDSTLITASNSKVVLINGAQACNIFWQVGSSATLGTGSHLEGTILAATSITLGHAATVNGRVLAQNGAVTMDTNTVENVPCEDPTPAPDPAAGPEWISGVAHGSPPMNEIDWAPVEDATAYHVFRAPAGGAAALLAETDGATTYKDFDVDVGTTYHYHVTALVDGTETAPSPIAEVTTIPVFTTVFAVMVAALLGIGAYAAIRGSRRNG